MGHRRKEDQMISYEDLCQALDRFNARRRNELEMANLEAAPEEPAGAADMSAQVAADFAADATAGEEFPVADPPEEPASAQADVDASSATAEAPMAEEAPEAAVAAEDAEPAGDGFADQAPEDTHEIDVDDVMVEDRLSDDKLPGD
jgi:hypothetical protein